MRYGLGKVYIDKVSYDFGTCSKAKERLEMIDQIIDAALASALISVGNGNKVRYKIDTGQTIQEVELSDPDQVTKMIMDWEKIRQYYINRLTPRVFTSIHKGRRIC